MEQNDIVIETLRKRIDKDIEIDKLQQSSWQKLIELSVKEVSLRDNF
jgi:hypothetical protein